MNKHYDWQAINGLPIFFIKNLLDKAREEEQINATVDLWKLCVMSGLKPFDLESEIRKIRTHKNRKMRSADEILRDYLGG